MRYSHQRERIFRAVSERCDHPTANMVYEQLKVEMPRLSLGTVYRNLNQLADGSCRFDKTKESHSHIVCDECGAVSDVHLPSFESFEHAIESETGYELRTYDVVLRGVCKDCRACAEQAG